MDKTNEEHEEAVTRFAKEIGASSLFYVGAEGQRWGTRYVGTITEWVQYGSEGGHEWMLAYLKGVASYTKRVERMSAQTLEAVEAAGISPSYTTAYNRGQWDASTTVGRQRIR